jgi:NAD+ synthase (glutamine-hydrolysing)
MKIALAQINSAVGDISGNGQKIIARIHQAKKKRVDLIAFPELSLTGYPPEDLVLKSHFVEDNIKALKKIVPHCSGIATIIGFVDTQSPGLSEETKIYNSAAVIYDKKIQLIYHKCHLPNYGVFDEARYFHQGASAPVFVLKGVAVGVNICEDIWHEHGPVRTQTLKGGAKLIINISASPYRIGIGKSREKVLALRAKENKVVIAYINMVGGQDDLVFDGGSLVFNEKGRLVARAKPFEEELIIADLNLKPPLAPPYQGESLQISKRRSKNEEIYRALQIGLFDYVHKNKFKTTVIAISGGIDSALTAIIAVDTLGKKNVVGVFMPSRYTSKESHEDAVKLAQNLGIRLITISIEPALAVLLDSLSASFGALPIDTTEENLQARIRGNMIMAISNKFGWLVLTTGNKSEMSVGYATLYGDMAGGFSVIKDLWKTIVYKLARYRNRQERIIPARILIRPPTAELRENQADSDSLPPYAILDPILSAYIEKDRSYDEIVAMGFDEKTVAKVIALVDNSEFKRRQAPLGVKITPKGLGKDRRMPITNGYKITGIK